MRNSFVLISVVAAAGALTGCSSVTDAVDQAAGGDVDVVYTLESDAPSISATYATADANGVGTSQENNVPAPWSKTVTAEDSLARGFVLTGAMNPVLDQSAPDGTTITCRITVDGEVVAEQTSTGQYAVVSCTSA
ncbi:MULTISPECIES: MmpS family transport accessory protein [unclassified Blastococcus]